ncbi:Crystal protein ET79 [Kitasatospora sp. McL0602]|uniref:Crystal protein ET79 n=1 Tax=Kitasatospora sp. McL0602 TaxID=3439530 RepID=UPI003F8B44B9
MTANTMPTTKPARTRGRAAARLAGALVSTILLGGTALAAAPLAQAADTPAAATAQPPKQLASARTTQVYLVNKLSGVRLDYNQASLSHGCWDNNNLPPGSIPPGHTGGWGSHSCGFLTGTQGQATFTAVDVNTGNAVTQLSIGWDNPYSGANHNTCTSSNSAYKCTPSGGDGKDATLTLTLTGPANAVRNASAVIPVSDGSPARSTQVTVYNNSGHILGRTSVGLDHGIWSGSQLPPSLINPGTRAVWSSESAGFMTGTEGSADYFMAGVGPVTITWDNPYSGHNGYTCTPPGGHSCSISGDNHNNARVTFNIY